MTMAVLLKAKKTYLAKKPMKEPISPKKILNFFSLFIYNAKGRFTVWKTYFLKMKT